MKLDDKHIEFYKNLNHEFGKTEDELWESISSKTQKITPIPKFKVYYSKWMVAATVTLLIGLTAFFRFYQTSVYVPRGEQASLTLPDNSLLSLNSDTKVSYKPFWWYVSREVELSGEAFFEVTKGSKFTISSENGETEILGTSLNIYARKKSYEVYCKTGKVKVSSVLDDQTYVITPGELVQYKPNKSELKQALPSEETISVWRNKVLSFSAVDLWRVVEELEIHFDIKIENQVPNSDSYSYTGLFNSDMEIEQVLTIISRSLNLNYKKTGDKRYKIY